MRTTFRTTAIAGGLFALFAFAPVSHAQAPATGSSAAKPGATEPTAEVAKRLIGNWEGTFATHGPEGELKLTFAKQQGWSARMTSSLEMMAPGAASDFRFDGPTVMWNQVLMDQPCRATALLEETTLKGEVACTHGVMTFVLKKK